MRVQLDSEKCQGHGRCYALAGEVFGADDDGYSVLKISGEIPARLEEQARLAVDNCPEFAIEIVKD